MPKHAKKKGGKLKSVKEYTRQNIAMYPHQTQMKHKVSLGGGFLDKVFGKKKKKTGGSIVSPHPLAQF